MVSKNSLKYIKSLQLKKYRQQEQSFCVEGTKSVLEVLDSHYTVSTVLGTTEFFAENGHSLKNNEEKLVLGAKELSKISSFKSNNSALAVVKMIPNEEFVLKEEWILGLDGINDPGNLGTILRVADWYGIKKIICSEDTVELYNPKTIASSMGSFIRTKVFYTDLTTFLKDKDYQVYGASMDGDDVHKVEFGRKGLLLLGSESHGIRSELSNLVDRKVTIPAHGSAESLNVAMAAAIIVDNIRRMGS